MGLFGNGAHTPRKVVALGATSGMGRALARKMAARGDRVFLLGIGEEDLERSSADLAARSRSTAPGWSLCNLEEPETFGAALDAADAALGTFDTVVITAALFGTQDQLEADPQRLQRMLNANFTNTILFCEEAKRRLLPRKGTLCVFSSVAGERGRKPVALYGAAKAGLSRYLEALDHKHHGEGLRVVAVKPGFVKTSMTTGLKPPPFAGEPEQVAERVLGAIDRGDPEVYAPIAWGPIMGVIRTLPRFVMRRVGF